MVKILATNFGFVPDCLYGLQNTGLQLKFYTHIIWLSYMSSANRNVHFTNGDNVITEQLTYWGRDKMTTNLMTISNAFPWIKIYQFRLQFHWSLFPWTNQKYSSIGSDNGLTPARRQAQGCHGQGKVREIPVFLRVRERSGNFVASQGIF